MPNSYLPQNAREFVQAMDSIIRAVSPDPDAYGITADELAEYVAERDAMNQAVIEYDMAKREYLGKSAHKKTRQRSADGATRFFVRKIRANLQFRQDPEMDGKLAAAGLRPHDTTRSPIQPVTPTWLTVMPLPGGWNLLRWDGAGNKPRTWYEIYIRIGDSPAFVYLTSTPRTRFRDVDRVPGEKVAYQVRAARGEEQSGFSNEASVN